MLRAKFQMAEMGQAGFTWRTDSCFSDRFGVSPDQISSSSSNCSYWSAPTADHSVMVLDPTAFIPTPSGDRGRSYNKVVRLGRLTAPFILEAIIVHISYYCTLVQYNPQLLTDKWTTCLVTTY
jgi:hypothetical protein